LFTLGREEKRKQLVEEVRNLGHNYLKVKILATTKLGKVPREVAKAVNGATEWMMEQMK
jgi:hypothetical protein